MFFDPLWFYLKQLLTTLIVEVGLFYFIVSKKPLRVLSAISFNVATHISLHIFFSMMLLTATGYNFGVYLIGEIAVTMIEATLYWASKSIPRFTKALLWSTVFNLASIGVGQLINWILF